MAAAYKVLGQSAAATAGTDAALYTAPAASQVVVSTITICNRGSTTTFRIRVAVDNQAVAGHNEQYLFYDAAIAANQTVSFTAGLTIDSTDVIYVQSASGSVSFQAFGQETT